MKFSDIDRRGRSEHPISVLSGWQPATSIYADVRYIDAVIVIVIAF